MAMTAWAAKALHELDLACRRTGATSLTVNGDDADASSLSLEHRHDDTVVRDAEREVRRGAAVV